MAGLVTAIHAFGLAVLATNCDDPGGAEMRRAKNSLLSPRRQRELRAFLRERGIPDLNSPEFAAEAHRQSLALANSPHEAEDQAFIDAVSEWNDE